MSCTKRDIALVVVVTIAILAVVFFMTLVFNNIETSGLIPVASYYGNNTIGVYCTHGTPKIISDTIPIIIKCVAP